MMSEFIPFPRIEKSIVLMISAGGLIWSSRWKRGIIACLLGLGAVGTNAWVIPSGSEQQVFERKSRHGAVASESSVCSSIGIKLLKMGVSIPLFPPI